MVSTVSILSDVAQMSIKYANPTISYISGCGLNITNNNTINNNSSTASPSSHLHSLSIENCNRYGGDIITVFGNNFGKSGASIIIGTTNCINTLHSSLTPHSLLTCRLPSGTCTSCPIFVLQNAGFISEGSGAELSYQECDKGTHASGFDCIKCEKGYYNGLIGAQSCIPCEAGNTRKIIDDYYTYIECSFYFIYLLYFFVYLFMFILY